ncbi:MAG: aminopeptidase P family N-terminal domain-containing protein, partial [Pseudomonadota bacterium]
MFPLEEYQRRISGVQKRMNDKGLDAILLTIDTDIRYITGYLTRFWESPTRPWFVIVPASGLPIAVIPAIGAHLMGQTVVQDIRTWSAPDYRDDGIGLLADALQEA